MDASYKSLLSLQSLCEKFSSWYILGISVLWGLLYFRKKLKYYIYHVMFYVYFTLGIIFATVTSLAVLAFQLPSDLILSTFARSIIGYLKSIDSVIEIRQANYLTDGNGTAAVLVLNHQHMLDIVVHNYVFLKYSLGYTSIMKKKLFPIWPLNTLARRICGVTLVNNDGSTTDQIRDDLRKMVDTANKRKWKIMFYPEGTRNDSSEKLLPFKKGAFKIAIDHQLPIIPGVISPYYFIDRRKKTFHQGRIIVEFLTPVSTIGLTRANLSDLIDAVHNKMSEKYSELQQEVLR